MKFRPILFSTAMVQANHAGRKNQTRRAKGLEYINGLPNEYRQDGISNDNPAEYWFERLEEDDYPTEIYTPVLCPYGQVGDVLWVREGFAVERWGYEYKADHPELKGGFKPSIHMPAAACRSWCIITGIEVQRLQDISEEDAIGEGIEVDEIGWYRLYLVGKGVGVTNNAKPSFQSLWQCINGLESWLDNPWVWVVRYEHTTTAPEGWEEYLQSLNNRRK
jgi:hypothetical protein